MRQAFPRIFIPVLLVLLNAPLALALPLTSNRDIDIQVSNNAGALYGSGADDSYWLYAPGGGLNQLHITTDNSTAGLNGQVTARTINTSSALGTFWASTTGGRGYNDDIILMFSMIGPISDDFSLHITSSGYQWTASSAGVVNPVYATGAVDETFTKDDFLYGPQTAKPGPGSGWVLPFYSGQDITDPSTAQYLMFIDLNVGNNSNRRSTDSGSAKVDFEISGIYETTIAFNVYAWAYSASVADSSINWTNRLSTNPSEPGQSGYSITTTAAVPTPEPATAGLCLAGMVLLPLLRRTCRGSSEELPKQRG